MRVTQPYRKGGSRGPSPVLSQMLAGKKPGAPGTGNNLALAMKKVTPKKQRTIPRY